MATSTVEVKAFQSAPIECSSCGLAVEGNQVWAMIQRHDRNNMAEHRVVHFTSSCLSVFGVDGTDDAVIMIGEVSK